MDTWLSARMLTRLGSMGRVAVRRLALAMGTIAIAWASMAYLVLPFALRHYEHQSALDGLQMTTRTADGLAGDPLNIGVVGSQGELVTAMAAAGWSPADPETLRTSI